jgi:type IV pilus assembly protein PilF
MMRQPSLVAALSLLVAACASSPELGEDAPENKIARMNTQMGQGYMERGQYEIALDKLKKAIKADPNYAPAHTVLAVLYERLGEQNLAERQYAEAVRAAPRDGDTNNNYGAFLCRNGQGRKAEPYFEAALKDPFYDTPAVAMANAGQCMLQIGDVDKAESYLRQSLGYDDDFPDALYGMARVSFDKGDFLRARAFLQRYEAVGAMSPESLLLGYRIESELGNSRDAKRHADELQQKFPKSAEAAQVRDTRL